MHFRFAALCVAVATTFILSLTVGSPNSAFSQSSNRHAADECHECPLPGARSQRDSLIDIKLSDQTTIQNAVSIKRVIVKLYGNDEQAVKICYYKGRNLVDTILPISQVVSLAMGSIGLSGQPLEIPVSPAREFYRNSDPKAENGKFLELGAMIGYGGSDTTRRNIGFSSMYYGAQLLYAPFNNLLGDNLALALNLGLLMEGGRMRFPIGGHLRWTFLGGEHVEMSNEFIPSPCQFRLPSDHSVREVPEGFEEVPARGKLDSTVLYQHERVVVKDKFRPFLYGEGGIILNGSFEGAGKDPSINPEEYGQYFWGLGVGLPVLDRFVISAGYKFLRLNLRTPCPVCPDDLFIQNTNEVHSAVLNVSVKIF